MKKLANLALVLTLLGACKTADAPASADGPSRAMLGLDDKPLTDEWTTWKPTSGESTPVGLEQSSSAFDYWQVTDPAYREEAWAAMFGLLTEVRRIVPREYIPTFRMLMTVLEPGMEEGVQRLDATFFAAKPGTRPMFEGVAWRMWRELPSGASPGVTVWMRRSEMSPETPTEAIVWFYGGFEETRSFTLRMSGKGAWTLSLADGLGFDAPTPMEGEAALLRGIVTETFWRPVIGSEYLETAIEKREKTLETPAQQPVALGLDLGDRDIDQVFTDSVFAPRLTIFPTKQK